MSEPNRTSQLARDMDALGQAARAAAPALAISSGEQRNAALVHAAAEINQQAATLLAANEKDMQAARAAGLGAAMLDRLQLDESRIAGMADGLHAIAALPDPLGRVLEETTRPNGLRIERVSVPLGVIGIIYESRPNVTADASGLCLKSGNPVILRGGSESLASSQAIWRCMQAGIERAELPIAAVQMVPTSDRAAVGYMLSSMSQFIDVVVPRGGKGLIRRVQQDARVPVIGHLEGLCHVYLHESANASMAEDIVVNAKMRRTGICGAAETVLVDRAIARSVLPGLVTRLQQAGCEVRGDNEVRAVGASVVAASEEDWRTEYLDAIIAIRVVDGIDAAMRHIRDYGSGHTESIIAEDERAVKRFFAELDSAILLHNASTQFADGGEFGMGAEIGIATSRIHARGPVGAAQLTSYKYLVHGSGQTRP